MSRLCLFSRNRASPIRVIQGVLVSPIGVMSEKVHGKTGEKPGADGPVMREKWPLDNIPLCG